MVIMLREYLKMLKSVKLTCIHINICKYIQTSLMHCKFLVLIPIMEGTEGQINKILYAYIGIFML